MTNEGLSHRSQIPTRQKSRITRGGPFAEQPISRWGGLDAHGGVFLIGLPGPGAVLKDHKGAFGHLSGRWRASGCRSYPRDYPQYRPSADGVVHPKVRTRCGHFAATVREKGETATGDRRTSPWTRAISLLSLDDLCPGCIHGRKVKQATTFMRAEPSWLQETSGCCLGGTCTGFPGPVHLTPL